MQSIAVVIPAYRAVSTIMLVLAQIGPEVDRIYVVDDCCPENIGAHVEKNCTDPRVTVLRNKVNQGVGGATLAGYAAAISDGAFAIVKIDSDVQMDPSLVKYFVAPLLAGQADYAKGNRFYNAASLASMPRLRLAGNAALSIMSKFSSEPPRVLRRLFGLSHAAMAGSSSIA